MSQSQTTTIQQEVNTILRDGHLLGNTDVKVSGSEVTIWLFWSESKTGHETLQRLMFQNGFFFKEAEVTESNDTGRFSAKHTFIRMVA